MEQKPQIIQYLELVAPFIPFHIYWGDTTNLTVLSANQSCLEAMGAKIPEDEIGKTPYDYYPKKIADNIIEHVKKVVDFFKKHSKKYQTKINDVLLAFVNSYEKSHSH